jgi:hypothetical protein
MGRLYRYLRLGYVNWRNERKEIAHLERFLSEGSSVLQVDPAKGGCLLHTLLARHIQLTFFAHAHLTLFAKRNPFREKWSNRMKKYPSLPDPFTPDDIARHLERTEKPDAEEMMADMKTLQGYERIEVWHRMDGGIWGQEAACALEPSFESVQDILDELGRRKAEYRFDNDMAKGLLRFIPAASYSVQPGLELYGEAAEFEGEFKIPPDV